ncbi:MAG: hypothetical protein IJM30_03535 [Thermoguttaceae bacterium]|nr:hypothetical protein [Thermoguttaceae bacterium]
MKPKFARLTLMSVSLALVLALGAVLGRLWLGVDKRPSEIARYQDYFSPIKSLDYPTPILESTRNLPDYSLDESRSREPLLETIKKRADSIEFFSLPLFLDMRNDDLNLSFRYRDAMDRNWWRGIYLPVTFERFQEYDALYEAAKRATGAEIVDCLAAFDDLSIKGKAFVLASAALYMRRSEEPTIVDAASETQIPEPLSFDEKLLLQRIVQDCVDRKYDPNSLEYEEEKIAFETLEGSQDEWDKSFREGALALQKSLGTSNPFSPFSPQTETKWRAAVDESSESVLFTMLALETRLNIKPECLWIRDANSFLQSKKLLKTRNGLFGNDLENRDAPLSEQTRLQVSAMKHFLFFQINSSMNSFYYEADCFVYPPSRPYKRFKEQSLKEIACEIPKRFPDIEIERDRCVPIEGSEFD